MNARLAVNAFSIALGAVIGVETAKVVWPLIHGLMYDVSEVFD